MKQVGNILEHVFVFLIYDEANFLLLFRHLFHWNRDHHLATNHIELQDVSRQLIYTSRMRRTIEKMAL